MAPLSHDLTDSFIKWVMIWFGSRPDLTKWPQKRRVFGPKFVYRFFFSFCWRSSFARGVRESKKLSHSLDCDCQWRRRRQWQRLRYAEIANLNDNKGVERWGIARTDTFRHTFTVGWCFWMDRLGDFFYCVCLNSSCVWMLHGIIAPTDNGSKMRWRCFSVSIFNPSTIESAYRCTFCMKERYTFVLEIKGAHFYEAMWIL